MNNDPSFELVQSSSVQALERASIDGQIATARAYPRSLETFKRKAKEMACLDVETAKSCIYHRPVGKDPETGQQKIAEGESIRMAEIVAASFGNLRVSARIVERTPRYVKAEGVAWDLESNYAGKSETTESTVTKKGQPYSDRQAELVAKVAVAKAYRDAVFRVVPKSMCKFIRLAAEAVIRKEAKPLEERRAGAVAWAKSQGVELRRFFAALGVKGEADLGEDELMTLTGIRTALKEDDTTLDEAFPPFEPEAAPKASATPSTPPSPPPPVQPASAAQPTEPQKVAAQPPAQPATTAPVAPTLPPVESGPVIDPSSPQGKLQAGIEGAGKTFEQFKAWAMGEVQNGDSYTGFLKWPVITTWGLIPNKAAALWARAIPAIVNELH